MGKEDSPVAEKDKGEARERLTVVKEALEVVEVGSVVKKEVSAAKGDLPVVGAEEGVNCSLAEWP